MKDELADTGVIVTGLVAYSGENAHSQSVCKDSDNVIVSFNIFNSVETFKAFCRIYFREKEFEDLVLDPAVSAKGKKSAFQAVASKILGYLAHLQFIMFEKPILPLKKCNPTYDISQAKLLLDRYQMEIAYSDDKRVWLEGNYGTGKFVVALKKLELLCKSLKEKEVIYYVNFARKSPFDFVIKQRFEKNGNIKAINSDFSLSRTTNLQILPQERELGTKNVHLIVDQYGSQELSIEEAKSLGQILREEEEFINSTVLITVQPIEVKRVDIFFEDGIKRGLRLETDTLIHIMGMKKKVLRNVMRTTVEINTLAEITQAYLGNQSNQYVRFQNSSPKSSSSSFQSQRVISDYYQLHKLVPTAAKPTNLKGKESYQETVTKYRYTCESQIGHGIRGPLPRLIKLSF